MEISDTVFVLLIVGYVIGGLVCLALAATGFGGNRIANGLIGLVAIGYAVYLLVAPAENVWIFPYFLAVPFLVLFRAFRGGRPARRRRA